jgi:hypothetical protein
VRKVCSWRGWFGGTTIRTVSSGNVLASSRLKAICGPRTVGNIGICLNGLELRGDAHCDSDDGVGIDALDGFPDELERCECEAFFAEDQVDPRDNDSLCHNASPICRMGTCGGRTSEATSSTKDSRLATRSVSSKIRSERATRSNSTQSIITHPLSRGI